MEQQTIDIGANTFRVKKMNAIETLALRTASNIDDTKSAQKFFNEILERIEVQVADKWLPVKDKTVDAYYPAGIEDDVDAIQQLINFFMTSFLHPVFTKSAE